MYWHSGCEHLAKTQSNMHNETYFCPFFSAWNKALSEDSQGRFTYDKNPDGSFTIEIIWQNKPFIPSTSMKELKVSHISKTTGLDDQDTADGGTYLLEIEGKTKEDEIVTIALKLLGSEGNYQKCSLSRLSSEEFRAAKKRPRD